MLRWTTFWDMRKSEKIEKRARGIHELSFTYWGTLSEALSFTDIPCCPENLEEWGEARSPFVLSWRMSYRQREGAAALCGLFQWPTKLTAVFCFVTICLMSFLQKLYVFFKGCFFTLQFVLWSLPYYFLLLLLRAGIPRVLPEPTAIHQSDFLWICLQQELPGCPPFVMIWRDDINRQIPTVNPRGGEGNIRLLPFAFLQCHYTLCLIWSDSTPATKTWKDHNAFFFGKLNKLLMILDAVLFSPQKLPGEWLIALTWGCSKRRREIKLCHWVLLGHIPAAGGTPCLANSQLKGV